MFNMRHVSFWIGIGYLDEDFFERFVRVMNTFVLVYYGLIGKEELLHKGF